MSQPSVWSTTLLWVSCCKAWSTTSVLKEIRLIIPYTQADLKSSICCHCTLCNEHTYSTDRRTWDICLFMHIQRNIPKTCTCTYIRSAHFPLTCPCSTGTMLIMGPRWMLVHLYFQSYNTWLSATSYNRLEICQSIELVTWIIYTWVGFCIKKYSTRPKGIHVTVYLESKPSLCILSRAISSEYNTLKQLNCDRRFDTSINNHKEDVSQIYIRVKTAL